MKEADTMITKGYMVRRAKQVQGEEKEASEKGKNEKKTGEKNNKIGWFKTSRQVENKKKKEQ